MTFRTFGVEKDHNKIMRFKIIPNIIKHQHHLKTDLRNMTGWPTVSYTQGISSFTISSIHFTVYYGDAD